MVSKITGGPKLWRCTRYRCSELAANAAETSLNISLFEWQILEEPQLQHSGETNVAQVNTATEKFVIHLDKTSSKIKDIQLSEIHAFPLYRGKSPPWALRIPCGNIFINSSLNSVIQFADIQTSAPCLDN